MSTDSPSVPSSSEEPQNVLTRKFTDAEWTALKELRSQLQAVYDGAYRDGKTKEASTIDAQTNEEPDVIKLWGIIIDPKGTPNARASVALMKFLRARTLDVEEAKKMLVNTLKWRRDFKVEELSVDQFPQDIFGSMGQIYGKDKEGRPVVYNLYGGNQDLKAVFGDVERFLKWRVAFMEKSVAQLDFENVDQMIQVHDYEGVGLTSRDANSKKAASEASTIFQDHYPEFLYKKLFVNVPAIFAWIFWIFKPIVSAQTLAKMSVVGTGPKTIGKEILPYVDAKDLPKRYGGDAEGF